MTKGELTLGKLTKCKLSGGELTRGELTKGELTKGGAMCPNLTIYGINLGIAIVWGGGLVWAEIQGQPEYEFY